jgi:putative oxidoreductase
MNLSARGTVFASFGLLMEFIGKEKLMATQPRYDYPDTSKPPSLMPAVRRQLPILAPMGRLLFASIFLISAPMHFSSDHVKYAAQAGVPLPGLAVPLSGLLALAGGLSILLGYHARSGAWVLILFLIPVTLLMHNFWAFADPAMRQMQMANFMKNLSMVGAALLIAYFGAGPMSLDARR